jgi:hypothetical protein
MAFMIIAKQWKIPLYSPFCHRTIYLYSALSTRKISAQIIRFSILKMSCANLYYNVSELGRKKTSTAVIAYMCTLYALQLRLSCNFDVDNKLYYLSIPCYFEHLLNCSLAIAPHIQGQIVDVHLDKFCYSLL